MIPGKSLLKKIFGFFATKMPKLPHSEPLTAELSGAVDSGTQPSIAGSEKRSPHTS